VFFCNKHWSRLKTCAPCLNLSSRTHIFHSLSKTICKFLVCDLGGIVHFIGSKLDNIFMVGSPEHCNNWQKWWLPKLSLTDLFSWTKDRNPLLKNSVDYSILCSGCMTEFFKLILIQTQTAIIVVIYLHSWNVFKWNRKKLLQNYENLVL